MALSTSASKNDPSGQKNNNLETNTYDLFSGLKAPILATAVLLTGLIGSKFGERKDLSASSNPSIPNSENLNSPKALGVNERLALTTEMKESFKSLVSSATKGDVVNAEMDIENIRKNAEQLKFPLTMKLEEEIATRYREALNNGISESLRQLPNEAAKGNVIFAELHIQNVEEFAKKLKNPLTQDQENMLAENRRLALTVGINESFKTLSKYAAEGEVRYAESDIRNIRKYAAQLQVPLTLEQEKELAENYRLALTNGLRITSEGYKNSTKQGDAGARRVNSVLSDEYDSKLRRLEKVSVL